MGNYYDREGKTIESAEAWALKATDEYRRVGEDQVGSHWVSTVWLGLDHQFRGEGPPLIFETMIFECDDSGNVMSWSEEFCDRYSTEAEARAGHERVVEGLRAGKTPDELYDEEAE